jgi:hypothetical protein
MRWATERWQTWATRLLAIFISLLAIPAIEVIRSEPTNQWLPRILLILLVVVVSLLCGMVDRLPTRYTVNMPWSLYIFLGVVGGLLPSWAYLSIRPAVGSLIGSTPGFGPGFWFNIGGNLLVISLGIYCLHKTRSLPALHSV